MKRSRLKIIGSIHELSTECPFQKCQVVKYRMYEHDVLFVEYKIEKQMGSIKELRRGCSSKVCKVYSLFFITGCVI